MTNDDFQTRYRLLQRVTEGTVETHHAVARTGAVVMVHLIAGAAEAERRELLALVEALDPAERRRVLEVSEVDGHTAIVTRFIMDFSSLRGWLEAGAARGAPRPEGGVASRAATAPPADQVARAEPQPHAPGEFTRLFKAPLLDAVPPPEERTAEEALRPDPRPAPERAEPTAPAEAESAPPAAPQAEPPVPPAATPPGELTSLFQLRATTPVEETADPAPSRAPAPPEDSGSELARRFETSPAGEFDTSYAPEEESESEQTLAAATPAPEPEADAAPAGGERADERPEEQEQPRGTTEPALTGWSWAADPLAPAEHELEAEAEPRPAEPARKRLEPDELHLPTPPEAIRETEAEPAPSAASPAAGAPSDFTRLFRTAAERAEEGSGAEPAPPPPLWPAPPPEPLRPAPTRAPPTAHVPPPVQGGGAPPPVWPPAPPPDPRWTDAAPAPPPPPTAAPGELSQLFQQLHSSEGSGIGEPLPPAPAARSPFAPPPPPGQPAARQPGVDYGESYLDRLHRNAPPPAGEPAPPPPVFGNLGWNPPEFPGDAPPPPPQASGPSEYTRVISALPPLPSAPAPPVQPMPPPAPPPAQDSASRLPLLLALVIVLLTALALLLYFVLSSG